MDAKKCDRCGKYYDKNSNTLGRSFKNSNGVTNLSGMAYINIVNDVKGRTDLCDECIEKLMKFMKMEDMKEE